MKAVLLALAAAALVAVPVSATPAEESAGNGFVMIVHATLEPRGVIPGPPVGEAFLATREGDSVVFHAIAFGVASGRPEVLEDATLEIVGADGSSFVVAANGAPAGRPVCEEETNLPGHEGDLAACLVFLVDAALFEGNDVVTLVLRAETLDEVPVTETYNAAAHGMLHAWAEGGPVTLEQADGFADPTPFVVEHAVDPVA